MEGIDFSKFNRDELLTRDDVARVFGVSSKTVDKWTFPNGSLPVFRRGKVVRYSVKSLQAWIETEMQNARDTAA